MKISSIEKIKNRKKDVLSAVATPTTVTKVGIQPPRPDGVPFTTPPILLHKEKIESTAWK